MLRFTIYRSGPARKLKSITSNATGNSVLSLEEIKTLIRASEDDFEFIDRWTRQDLTAQYLKKIIYRNEKTGINAQLLPAAIRSNGFIGYINKLESRYE